MSPAKMTVGLCGWLLACFAAAAMGGWFMPGEWYATLKKPSWNPPGWIFGPVWTALYTMMSVAAWLVWRQGGWGRQRRPLILFLVQLALNALWTPLFFGLHRPDLAFAEIVCGNRVAVAGHCRHAGILSAGEPRRRLAPCALPGLGGIRGRVKLHLVAAQPVNS